MNGMDAPLGSQGKKSSSLPSTQEEKTVQGTRIGLDIAKNVFQVHGVDAHGKVVIRKQLSRNKVLRYLAQLPVCRIGIEACASAHYWGRECRNLATMFG